MWLKPHSSPWHLLLTQLNGFSLSSLAFVQLIVTPLSLPIYFIGTFHTQFEDAMLTLDLLVHIVLCALRTCTEFYLALPKELKILSIHPAIK